jgi:hypothetical protein
MQLKQLQDGLALGRREMLSGRVDIQNGGQAGLDERRLYLAGVEMVVSRNK